MIKSMRSYFKKQNRMGKFLWLRTLVRSLLNVWEFYPFWRFVNFLHFFFLAYFQGWRPLKIDPKVENGVFYICLAPNRKQLWVVKIPHLNSIHSYYFCRKIHNRENFDEYSKMIKAVSSDRLLGRHFPPVKEVKRNGSYYSLYIDGYNLLLLLDDLRLGRTLPQDIHYSDLMEAIEELLNNLNKFEQQNGRLYGDWGLNNLLYGRSAKKIKNVDLEGIYTYRNDSSHADLRYLEMMLKFIIEMLEMRQRRQPDDIKILNVLSAIGYSAMSGAAYSGSNYPSGYHSMRLLGRSFSGQRDCEARLANVPFDFTNKVVLDLGCNCGGMLHSLAEKIAMGIGLDYDAKCINAANLIKELNQKTNLHFFVFDLEKEELAMMKKYFLDSRIDICFLLSVCLWIKSWKSVVRFSSILSKTLLFESNGDDLQQQEEIAFLNTCFRKVTLVNARSFDDPQNKRMLYLCSNP